MVFVRHIRLSNTCYQDFFSYGSVLKGKSEIKFHSLVTPHLCFYVTEDLKRKRNWFTLSFVTVPSCELHLHRDSLMLRRPRRLESLNNNLNSVLHVPYTASERQSWFYLAITQNNQVLENNNKTHWTLCETYTYILKYRFQVI